MILDEMREFAEKETVSLSINFSHEIDAAEIQNLEELGLMFIRIGEEVVHSGAI